MAVLKFQNVGLHKPDGAGDHVRILEDITLDIEKGEIFAFAGPSGSGKSSVLRLINRLDDCTEGKVILDDVPLAEWDIVRLRQRVGFMFQEAALFEGTVRENVLFGPCLHGLRRCDEQKTALNLLERVGLSQKLLNRSVEALSGGQKQRVNLARTLALDPEIVLMDEPTSSLDPASARVVETLAVSLNKQEGKTLIMVSHDLEQIEHIAHRCAVLNQGKLRFVGTPDDLKHNQETLKLLMEGEGGGDL